MAEPSHHSEAPRCINCNFAMRFSCTEVEKPGFIHNVFECPRCRSTQSFVTADEVVVNDSKARRSDR